MSESLAKESMMSDSDMLTFIEKYGWKIEREDHDGKMWWECCNYDPHGFGDGDTVRDAIRSSYDIHLKQGGEPIANQSSDPTVKESLTTQDDLNAEVRTLIRALYSDDNELGQKTQIMLMGMMKRNPELKPK